LGIEQVEERTGRGTCPLWNGDKNYSVPLATERHLKAK